VPSDLGNNIPRQEPVTCGHLGRHLKVILCRLQVEGRWELNRDEELHAKVEAAWRNSKA
jgi:hypothetical protein